jgi:hypothetical protein
VRESRYHAKLQKRYGQVFWKSPTLLIQFFEINYSLSNKKKKIMDKLSYRTRTILIGLFVLFAVNSCKQGENYSQLEEQAGKITSLTELGTVEYVISKIVKADDNATWYKFGDRKILFNCKAILKAGIDLSSMTDNDIKTDFDNKSISLILPKATLLSLNMKPEDITLVYEKTAITRSAFSNKERDAVLAQGEKDIRENVFTMGILADAEDNAKSFLESFLKQAGFTKINVEFKNK